MYRHFLCVAATAISVSGCQNGVINQSNIDQVQTIAVAVCGFLPTVETVANLIAPGIAVIPSQVAQAICDAVRPGGMSVQRPRGTAPQIAYVGKVQIKGEFVR